MNKKISKSIFPVAGLGALFSLDTNARTKGMMTIDVVAFDCGSKLGYMQATVDFSRRHPEVGVDFSNYLKNLE